MSSNERQRAPGGSTDGAILRAIVAVDQADRVQCQQPGCGHSVYAAVHVVEEHGRLLVLGSTCFAKRYGAPNALGAAKFGAGAGRKLTEEEREMLLRNTEALLAHFEAEARAAAEAQAKRLEDLRREQVDRHSHAARQFRPALNAGPAALTRQRRSPWPWQKAWSSVALFTAPSGENWVRVQHQDDSQKLVPWPRFDGWETALPSSVGVADPTLGGIAVDDIVEAIRTLQRNGFRGPLVGSWQQVHPKLSF